MILQRRGHISRGGLEVFGFLFVFGLRVEWEVGVCWTFGEGDWVHCLVGGMECRLIEDERGIFLLGWVVGLKWLWKEEGG